LWSLIGRCDSQREFAFLYTWWKPARSRYTAAHKSPFLDTPNVIFLIIFVRLQRTNFKPVVRLVSPCSWLFAEIKPSTPFHSHKLRILAGLSTLKLQRFQQSKRSYILIGNAFSIGLSRTRLCIKYGPHYSRIIPRNTDGSRPNAMHSALFLGKRQLSTAIASRSVMESCWLPPRVQESEFTSLITRSYKTTLSDFAVLEVQLICQYTKGETAMFFNWFMLMTSNADVELTTSSLDIEKVI